MWRLGGAEDRRFGASARAQFEPEEQEGVDVDEDGRDRLDRRGGRGGAGFEV